MQLMPNCTTQTGVGQPGSCPGFRLVMALKRHWNYWKCGASKLKFPQAQEFLRKLSATWKRALKKKKFCQPSPKPKNCKNISF